MSTKKSYKVVAISLYLTDIEALEQKVQTLKERGHKGVSKSGLIRFALDTVNLDNYKSAR